MLTKRDTNTSDRKSDHIRINLENDVKSGLTNGLERWQFIHQALPELDYDQINLRTSIFGKTLYAPLLISSMTGGAKNCKNFNEIFAKAAQETGIAMGVGSQRAALEDPTLIHSFEVRKYAPDILLFANIGAIQLNYGFDLETCKRAVDMIQADALYLHLNPLQEVLQPEGNTNFRGLIKKIESICSGLTCPVIIKEVGWGISGEIASTLFDLGVSAIDVAGTGGTSWSQIESFRGDEENATIAASFKDWGIPTETSIQLLRKSAPNMMIFASGGITNGVEVAKCLALGAILGGLARPFLQAADNGEDVLIKLINRIKKEIKICMFCTGKSNLNELDTSTLMPRL